VVVVVEFFAIRLPGEDLEAAVTVGGVGVLAGGKIGVGMRDEGEGVREERGEVQCGVFGEFVGGDNDFVEELGADWIVLVSDLKTRIGKKDKMGRGEFTYCAYETLTGC
jgi:hypothetical protein